MLAGTVIENRTIFILQQDFGILPAHPHRGRGSRSTHNDFQIIFGSKSYCFIQPGKIVSSFFRLQLCPCKLRKVSKLKSQFMHLLEITFPLTFIPVFGIIINSCQCQVLIVEPGRSLCFYRLMLPVIYQRLYDGSIYRKGSPVADSLRKRNLIGYIFPRFTMIQRTDSSVTMITILIKIHIKRITHKKRCRSFRPIFSGNRGGYLCRKTFGNILRACHTQVFLRRIGVLVLDDHDQISLCRIFHDSRVDHTEIGIEKHLRL